MARDLQAFFSEHGSCVAIAEEVVPLADQFPFAVCGVPSVWLGRNNCTAGRFFHHLPDDTISRVDISLVTQQLNISGAYLAKISQKTTLPFPLTIPRNQAVAIENTCQELFGGWTGYGDT